MAYILQTTYIQIKFLGEKIQIVHFINISLKFVSNLVKLTANQHWFMQQLHTTCDMPVSEPMMISDAICRH